MARPTSRTLLLCGCGEQGRAHVEALREVLPIERCLLWDRDEKFASALAVELAGTDVSVAHDLSSAAPTADVIACCTSAQEPYLQRDIVGPGTFIAAVGSDSPAKSEVAPQLLAAATVVTDVTAQCAEMGDLHHAIEAGVMAEADVYAELGEVVLGAKPGRSSLEEIIIFDSTGTGLQDVASAAAIYERCVGDSAIKSIALAAS